VLRRHDVDRRKALPMTEARFDAILMLVRTGMTFSAACLEQRVQRRDFYNFRQGSEEREKRYEDARERCIEAWVDEIFRIADDPQLSSDQKRVMIDARKWWAASMRPQKYGERSALDQLMQNGITLSISTKPKERLPAPEVIDVTPEDAEA
jgi:hypothetical protein